ncbi:hypothetical protein [Variovorax sp. OV700]|jgi:hypothetical protein|uniref:hypothetical protein n=1 Tax=Variovorax sp. OV700 TaxID=1882826 RepID=UPI00087FCDDA|nr:hypothetical protein [Variovorax sp. OV700]SDJ15699.1 hypothetical protein SAMN05444748_110150 [Variovorax sp. OV700]
MTSTTQIDGRIVGNVEFRAGDGPKLKIPEGNCQILMADDSVVVTWQEGGQSLTAAIPKIEFDRYIQEGAVVLGRG